MSSSSTDDEPVLVGTLGRPHGLHGELTIRLESDFPERFSPGMVLDTDRGSSLTVEAFRHGPRYPLVSFEEVTDRDTAETWRGARLMIEAGSRRSLDDGEFWPEDIVGLTVVDENGVTVGTVVDVILTDLQDRLVISTLNGRAEIPLVDDLVPMIDVEQGLVTVTPIDGLF
ncbi:MAG: 16S rRNA processing protein RimM [Acidimicrobiia bacterium]|nr:16S rRNA processing protein RimM [Acidimicrobiia bacterium]